MRARKDLWLALSEAYAAVARMHNHLGLTDPLPAEPMPFHGCPFTVISGGHFANALRARLTDPDLCALPFTCLPYGAEDWLKTIGGREWTLLELARPEGQTSNSLVDMLVRWNGVLEAA